MLSLTDDNAKISGGGPRGKKKKEKSGPRHPLHFFVRSFGLDVRNNEFRAFRTDPLNVNIVLHYLFLVCMVQ